MLKHFLGIRCVWPKNLEFRKFKKLFFFHFSVFVYLFINIWSTLCCRSLSNIQKWLWACGAVESGLQWGHFCFTSRSEDVSERSSSSFLHMSQSALLQEGRRPISPVRCISPASVRHKCSSWRKKLLRQCEIHQTLPVCDLSRGAMGFAPTWVFGKNDWV